MALLGRDPPPVYPVAKVSQKRLTSKRYTDFRSDLEGFTQLDVRFVEGLKIEGGIVGIGEVAAPQVDAHDAFTGTDLGIERAVKALVNVISLGPKDLTCSTVLGGGRDLVDPAALQQSGVIQADIQRVARGVGNGITGKVLLAIVIITEGGPGESVVRVRCPSIGDPPA